MVFQYYMVVIEGGSSRKALDDDFMKENFGEIHKEATGSDIKKGGYPDSGSGRYVMALGYKGWMQFNKA